MRRTLVMNHIGKMKLLLSGLVLCSLSTPLSLSVNSDEVNVYQTPDVTVHEGEAVTIHCCCTEQNMRYRVVWGKNQTVIKEETHIKSQCKEEVNDEKKCCFSLNFPNISRNDAGRYICSITVEIPTVRTFTGNGTTITVTKGKNNGTEDEKKNEDDPGKFHTVIIATGSLVPLLFIVLICFCFLRKKQAQAARVIYEVPHIDSEEIEMDKHSTSSSRGSSQWCQVPVYEPFDYFEQGQTKGSG